jgi:hypothetical protein
MTEESIQFHIRSNDYFGTLATVLDLLRQDARRGYTEKHDATLQRLRDDLVLLQRRCAIVERAAVSSSTPVEANS